MDNLTHSLVGLMLSRSGLNRLHPNAGWLLVLAANAPDVDVVSLAAGPAAYLHFHRWFTHSWIAIPLVAILPVVLVWWFRRRGSFAWRSAYLLSLAGVLSHVLLDWTNPYGIRLFLPFSNAWPALHWTSVVDFWIWVVLLVATLWPMLSGLVGSEMGAKKRPLGQGWAITALSFVVLYNAGRAALHNSAVELQAGRVYAGQAAQRAWAMPQPFNPLVWNGVVETSSAWVVQTVDLRRELIPAASRVLYKAEATPAIEAARKAPVVAEFLRFSRTPHWTATPSTELENGTRVEVMDLRLGFTAWALVDAGRKVRESGFQFGP